MNTTLPLHHAARLIVSLEADRAEEGVQLLNAAIDAGHDVNALDGEGGTALAVLCGVNKWTVLAEHGDRGVLEWEVLLKRSMGVLLRAGADPWIGKPNAWSIALPWSDMNLFRERNKISHLKLGLGPNGENDLHALLSSKNNVLYLSAYPTIVARIKTKWLSELDHLGDTPLHKVWGNQFGEEDWRAFEVVSNLIKLGAKVDIPNAHGKTVASVIRQRPRLHESLMAFPDLVASYNEIASIADREVLVDTTPSIPQSRSNGMRL